MIMCMVSKKGGLESIVQSKIRTERRGREKRSLIMVLITLYVFSWEERSYVVKTLK